MKVRAQIPTADNCNNFSIATGSETAVGTTLDNLKAAIGGETGASAKEYTDLGKLYPSPGYCGEIIHMYMATGLTFGEASPDEDEFLELERIPLEQAAQMVLDNRIPDAKTQAAVLKVYMKVKAGV